MIHAKRFTKFDRIGPGGWYCHCCGPSPKNRKEFIRTVKRGALKEYFRRYMKDELKE